MVVENVVDGVVVYYWNVMEVGEILDGFGVWFCELFLLLWCVVSVKLSRSCLEILEVMVWVDVDVIELWDFCL